MTQQKSNNMPTTTSAQKLQQALRDKAGKCPKVPVNHHQLRAKGQAVSAAADALLGYHRYRRSAGTWKATNKGSHAAFEQAALGQAHEAVKHARDLSRSAMGVLQQATHTGWLNDLHKSFAADLKRSGEVQAVDLWRQVSADAGLRARLVQLGISADVLSACDEHMNGMNASVVERDGAMVLRQGSQPELVIGGMPTGAPRDVLDLLQRGGASKLMEHMIAGRPGAVPSITVTPDRVPVDAFAAAGIALAATQVTAHYRRIQDTGVAAYAGEEFGTIILLIGLVLLVAGLIGTVATCDQDSDLYDPDICVASQLALFIGLFMMGWSAFLGPSIVATGTYVFGFPVLLAAVLAFEKVMDIDVTEEDVNDFFG